MIDIVLDHLKNISAIYSVIDERVDCCQNEAVNIVCLINNVIIDNDNISRDNV